MKTKSPQSPAWWRCLGHSTRNTLKGHLLICAWLGLMLVGAILVSGVLLQRLTARAAEPDALEAAIALLQQGEARQAQAMFAAIDPKNPAYGMAQAYDALCRYEVCRAAETNDYQWFFAALESPAVQPAVLPVELREELAFDEIDALYQSGQFHTHRAIPTTKITAFQQGYPASARMGALGEYQLAAAFERGMRLVAKAGISGRDSFQKEWTNGLAQLEQFVSLIQALPADDYAVLRDRSLAEDVQVALAVLGGEPAALAEIPIRSAESRERYGVVRVGLHQKLHPEAWDQNLEMLADFHAELQTLPASRVRARVVHDLAQFGFQTGEDLWLEAGGGLPDAAQKAGGKRAVASRYFEIARAVLPSVRVDAANRIASNDVSVLRLGLFYSYYLEHDYARLSAATAAQLTNSTPGDLDWLLAKQYAGVALSCQTPPQPGAAAVALNEVLAYGFQNQKEHDWAVMAGVRWWVYLAMNAGDHAKALELIQWVEKSNGPANLKAKFKEDFAAMYEYLMGKEAAGTLRRK